MSPVKIFFMYLGGSLAAGAGAYAAVDMVAPGVAEDVKRSFFRRVLRRRGVRRDHESDR